MYFFELGKLKILCVNCFLILLKATTLNPYTLSDRLEEVDYILHSNCDRCQNLLFIFISIYLVMKFVMGYVTLGANVIAVFPILAEDFPNLLLPALFAQSIELIALNSIEVIMGLITLKLVAANITSIFFVFLLSKLLSMIFAITALNMYSDYYQQLKCAPLQLNLTPSTIQESLNHM